MPNLTSAISALKKSQRHMMDLGFRISTSLSTISTWTSSAPGPWTSTTSCQTGWDAWRYRTPVVPPNMVLPVFTGA